MTPNRRQKNTWRNQSSAKRRLLKKLMWTKKKKFDAVLRRFLLTFYFFSPLTFVARGVFMISFWRRKPSVGQFLGAILLWVVSEQKSPTPSWGLWNPRLPVSPCLPLVGRSSSSTDGKTKNLMNPRSSHSLWLCWHWKVAVKRETKSPNLYNLHFWVLVLCETTAT